MLELWQGKSKHSKSSAAWLQEHHSDQYVRKSKQDGYRSRAAYKLLELNKKYNLFKYGMNVVDLGAAPGGWSQVVQSFVTENGKVFALDILPIDPIANVDFIQGDFTEDEPYEKLLSLTEGKKINWVISDMAPNMTGNKSTDQIRSLYLVELATSFADQVLKNGGNFLAKIFHAKGAEDLIKELKIHYSKVIIQKPDSSRPRSSETYVIAFNKK